MTFKCYEQDCKLHSARIQMASQLAVMEEFALVESELNAQLRLALCKAIRIYPSLADEMFIQKALKRLESVYGDEYQDLFNSLTEEGQE